MGAAGDMLTAALIDTLAKPQSFVAKFNDLGIPGVKMALEEAESCGIRGRRVRVFVHGKEEGKDCEAGQQGHSDHAPHRDFEEIMRIIGELNLSKTVGKNAADIYRSIAEAEAKIHGEALDEIHFHELGSMDAIADVVAFCMLIEEIAPDEICASAVHVGSGHVRCAHGLLPVPAPAAAELLRGIPTYGGGIEGELCTPTGAALLKRYVEKFGPQPLMAVSSVGYGVGTKIFAAANCVRALIGETETATEAVEEIACNLDDMTGEAIGFAMERLLESGALDVFTVPIGMKKSRPAVMLCCLCRSGDTEKLSALMLRHTSSLGVRISSLRRLCLPRETEVFETPYGPVRIKTAGNASKPEYEDLARIARENDLTLRDAVKLIER